MALSRQLTSLHLSFVFYILRETKDWRSEVGNPEAFALASGNYYPPIVA